MNKFEYLSKLKNNLMSLPAKEREAAVRYYGNYFDDAGLSNEQDVIASLGSPENLAHKILNNSNKLSLTVKKTKKEVKAAKFGSEKIPNSLPSTIPCRTVFPIGFKVRY